MPIASGHALQPSLDESKERFTYGRPDAQLIRNFCLEKFGWNFEKVDEILDPVLKVGWSHHMLVWVALVLKNMGILDALLWGDNVSMSDVSLFVAGI